MNAYITEAAPQATLEAVRALPQAERDRQARREHRRGRHDDVMDLHRRGVSARAIATSLDLSRNTVRRLTRAPDFPETAPRPRRAAGTGPFADHLRRRWGEGCHNAALLWRELKGRGFAGSVNAVQSHVAPWQQELPAGRPRSWPAPSGAWYASAVRRACRRRGATGRRRAR